MNLEMENQNFLNEFNRGYKAIETKEKYDSRVDSEETIMLNMANFINEYNRSQNNTFKKYIGYSSEYLDVIETLQPDKIDNKGNPRFSDQKIDLLFRVFNGVNCISLEDQKNNEYNSKEHYGGYNSKNYFKTFKKIPEIIQIVDQMKKSPDISNLIYKGRQAEKNKNNFGLTPAEKNYIYAKRYVEKNGQNVFDVISRTFKKNTINWDGYDRNNEDDMESMAFDIISIMQQGNKVKIVDSPDGKCKVKSDSDFKPTQLKQELVNCGLSLEEIRLEREKIRRDYEERNEKKHEYEHGISR